MEPLNVVISKADTVS